MKNSKRPENWLYNELLSKAVNFEFKPDERVNESALSVALGVSRTPLREALNRLAAEDLLINKRNQGFFCRSLDPNSILDLYNARLAIESEAIRLAVECATDSQIHELQKFLDLTSDVYSSSESYQTLAELDETFHMKLVRLSGNKELERILTNLGTRIRFVRQIDMKKRRSVTPQDHQNIVDALAERDETRAIAVLNAHIKRRRREATEAEKNAYSKIYVSDLGYG